MSNYEVARYLLTHGLSNDFDGVVFLDHRDRKMIVSFVIDVQCILRYQLTHFVFSLLDVTVTAKWNAYRTSSTSWCASPSPLFLL